MESIMRMNASSRLKETPLTISNRHTNQTTAKCRISCAHARSVLVRSRSVRNISWAAKKYYQRKREREGTASTQRPTTQYNLRRIPRPRGPIVALGWTLGYGWRRPPQSPEKALKRAALAQTAPVDRSAPPRWCHPGSTTPQGAPHRAPYLAAGFAHYRGIPSSCPLIWRKFTRKTRNPRPSLDTQWNA